MKIEHVAINVLDPVAVALWYSTHLGLKVVRHIPVPTQTHFLADDSGETMLEIYCNPPDRVPDYASMNPLQLHIAFVSGFPADDSLRLIAAGASWVEEIKSPEGNHLVMLRDPWGLALQLCKRATPLMHRA